MRSLNHWAGALMLISSGVRRTVSIEPMKACAIAVLYRIMNGRYMNGIGTIGSQ
jgi:hypothetical protein